MSKEVEWGLIHGEGEIISTCDECGKTVSTEFDEGHPDYRQAQADIEANGWRSTKVNGEWRDFCTEECRNGYIKRHA
jgi:hypothetical protein